MGVKLLLVVSVSIYRGSTFCRFKYLPISLKLHVHRFWHFIAGSVHLYVHSLTLKRKFCGNGRGCSNNEVDLYILCGWGNNCFLQWLFHSFRCYYVIVKKKSIYVNCCFMSWVYLKCLNFFINKIVFYLDASRYQSCFIFCQLEIY